MHAAILERYFFGEGGGGPKLMRGSPKFLIDLGRFVSCCGNRLSTLGSDQGGHKLAHSVLLFSFS